jgi:uncharacterized protein
VRQYNHGRGCLILIKFLLSLSWGAKKIIYNFKIENMKCPRCQGELKEEKNLNIIVNRCNNCGGIWLDEQELGQVEDTVWSDEELKGTLETHERPSDLSCPKCAKTMIRFNYRYYDLELDTCPDLHGFWLDNGEEQKILELMNEDKSNAKRKMEAEDQWAISMSHIQSKTFMEKVKDLFR